MLVLQRSGVVRLDLGDHLCHAVRAKEGRAFMALELAHLFGHACALIEQREQLGIQAVDLGSQLGKGFRLNGGRAHARHVSNEDAGPKPAKHEKP